MHAARRTALSRGCFTVAVALLILGLVPLPWFRSGSGFFRAAGGHTFYEVHLALLRLRFDTGIQRVTHEVHFGLADAYFGWLGWLLAGVAAAAAVVAIVTARPWLRAAGALVAAAGVGFTLAALDLVSFSGDTAQRLNVPAPGYADFLAHSSSGAWCVLAGFVLLGVASALASSRLRLRHGRADTAASLAASRSGD